MDNALLAFSPSRFLLRCARKRDQASNNVFGYRYIQIMQSTWQPLVQCLKGAAAARSCGVYGYDSSSTPCLLGPVQPEC
jgi:hypothetical protein